MWFCNVVLLLAGCLHDRSGITYVIPKIDSGSSVKDL